MLRCVNIFLRERNSSRQIGQVKRSSISKGLLRGAVHTALIFTIFLLPASLRAGEGRGYLEVGGGYKTGDFGTPIRSNLYYFSTALGYVSPGYDVSVTVPYLFLVNSGSSQTGMMNMNSGLGDIILRGGRVLVPEGEKGFSLDGALAIKLPTADETKGLGTGETDYGAFLNLHQQVGGVKLTLLSGYIKVGEPAGIVYNDVYLYGMGISKLLDATEVYLSFEGSRAMVPGAQDPREIHAGAFHVLNTDYAVKGSAFAGLNNGGPDFGFEAGIVRWF